MQTYAELLTSLADHPDEPCQDFVLSETKLSRTTGEVLTAARTRGAQLSGLGVQRGDRVGILVSDPAEFLPLMHGCLLFGFVAVPMYPPPLFGKKDAYAATLRGILHAADAAFLVVERKSRLGELSGPRLIELGELGSLDVQATSESPVPLPAVTADDLAFLQFTSGSSGQPKGVRITHRCLMANARSIMVDGLGAGPGDRGVSWLPLYHDMGLIGFGLAPLLTQTKVTFIPTARFVKNPAIWLRTIHEYRATITFAPNFAYALVTRRADADGLDLSCVRMWGAGAEPISAHTLSGFEERFGAAGVSSGQVAPCYGLAEATLAVTFTAPEKTRIVDRIDADRWHDERVAVPTSSDPKLSYVSSGQALPGYQVRIVDRNGRALPERYAGEIIVKGPSVSDGYVGDRPADATFRDDQIHTGDEHVSEEPAEAAFRDDGLYTGDLGYLVNGHLFVTGRIKDTIIVGGRNYDPETIERLANQVEGVRLSAAVGVLCDGGEELAVIVECGASRDGVATRVRSEIASGLGVLATHVLSLPPGSIPRTTSGKLKRQQARHLAQTHLDAR